MLIEGRLVVERLHKFSENVSTMHAWLWVTTIECPFFLSQVLRHQCILICVLCCIVSLMCVRYKTHSAGTETSRTHISYAY